MGVGVIRSAASLEQRRAYCRAWRRAHPGYHRAWAAEHRADVLEHQRTWRHRRPELVRAQRSRYHRLTRARHPGELPPKHVGHPMFDAARVLVGPDRNSGLRWLIDPLHEDLLSVATLALIEGHDAAGAVRRYRSVEWAWRALIVPILPWSAEVHAA